jgi:hypothetical protein
MGLNMLSSLAGVEKKGSLSQSRGVYREGAEAAEILDFFCVLLYTQN